MKIKLFLIFTFLTIITTSLFAMDWWEGMDTSTRKEQRIKARQEREKQEEEQKKATAHAATQELLKILDELDTTPTDINKIKQLIAEGADINAKDTRGRTALSIAVAHEAIDIASLLLENGARIDTTIVIPGQTIEDTVIVDALDLAIATRNPDVVRLILEYQADPNHQLAPDEPTPLFAAIELHPEFPDQADQINGIIQLLLEFGADPNGSYNNIRPLQFAINHHDPESVRLLLQAGADPMHALQHAQLLLSVALGEADFRQLTDLQTQNQPAIKKLNEIIKMLLNPETIEKKGFKKIP